MSENRLAVVSLIIEDRAQSTKINSILSKFGNFVVGRMGVPYKERGVSVICVIVDAPNEIINTITGKIGMLDGVHAKTLMSKM
ncbi:MAG TPA: iron-only hydrogenase system regulator [Candidatus Coproplasma avicola]|uniref:Iron-only hydrogenase system regulator n=1 Tax=Candidatus Coproplasma avicola TaxID=2840744 RepID=A0A9D1E696_9FIRM|nr:iron-only hydrogenase system regulator [Candidatus Coproplasma avicola]